MLWVFSASISDEIELGGTNEWHDAEGVFDLLPGPSQLKELFHAQCARNDQNDLGSTLGK